MPFKPMIIAASMVLISLALSAIAEADVGGLEPHDPQEVHHHHTRGREDEHSKLSSKMDNKLTV